MRVLKFGGSSVADAHRIRQVGSIVASAFEEGPIVVVVSALGGITDDLVALADGAPKDREPLNDSVDAILQRHLLVLDEIAHNDDPTRSEILATIDELRRLVTGIGYIGDCPPAVRDRIIATGERLSAPIVAASLRAMGHPAYPVCGTEVIRTDSIHGTAEVDPAATTDLARQRLLDTSLAFIPVVTGFIGADRHGTLTTLGRGGSDLTATVLGAALEAERIEIWTDVNGIFTAPPRVVAGARPQPYVSYDEAAEMARFGAAVLFTKTIAPVRELGIPVLVCNTFDPDGSMTWVGREPDVPAGARSLASVEHAAVLKVRSLGGNGNAASAVAVISERCLIAAMAAASGEWTLVANQSDAESLHRKLSTSGLEVELIGGTSVVTVIGSRLLQQPWVAGRALEALGRRNIALKGLVSPSEHAFCVVVDHSDHERSLTILHEALMLPHLADRAANAARHDASIKGDNNGSTSHHRSRDRRDRNRRTAARPPAA
jgi:bifunctional aspartokinase / homoserine dehydrogenase 1